MKLIVNTDINWGIGRDNGLLFSNKEDMRFFREKTTGGTVVMGRKTLQSFPGGRPLKNRVNIVMTRDPAFDAEGAVICRTREELKSAICGSGDDVYLIGGASIYNEFMDCCSHAYVTRTYADGKADCFIHPFDGRSGWSVLEEGDLLTSGDGTNFRFVTYVNSSIKDIEGDVRDDRSA